MDSQHRILLTKSEPLLHLKELQESIDKINKKNDVNNNNNDSNGSQTVSAIPKRLNLKGIPSRCQPPYDFPLKQRGSNSARGSSILRNIDSAVGSSILGTSRDFLTCSRSSIGLQKRASVEQEDVSTFSEESFEKSNQLKICIPSGTSYHDVCENGMSSPEEGSITDVDEDDGLEANDDLDDFDDVEDALLNVEEDSLNEMDEDEIHHDGESDYGSSSCQSTPVQSTTSSAASLRSSGNLPLTMSMFENTPPTIYFTKEGEDGGEFPYDIRKMLRWKASNVTPRVVKSAITRAGFHITKRSSDWLGLWGKYIKPYACKSVQEFQKMNHFPGTCHIGRKDKLWRNYSRMKSTFGRQEFNFLPLTFILPNDISYFKRYWDERATKKWIVKPPASARGLGIRVVHKWSQLPKKRSIVQSYISKPFIINKRKFDLRIYVYVSSFDPLRIYIFQNGLVRFATEAYSTTPKSLSNKYVHLTNYSVNKNNKNVYNKSDQKTAHKWTLKELWSYLNSHGHDSSKIWARIKDIAVKTVICSESQVNSLTMQNMRSRYSCHELFGFDIILDSNLNPWLLEVNISPSLHSNSDLDKDVKGQLVKDLLNIAGFRLPRCLLSSKNPVLKEMCAENSWYSNSLSANEKSKHNYYVRHRKSRVLTASILDSLTPDDVKVLISTEDELSRCGKFERIFPNEKDYLQLFETPRYYNILLDVWNKTYPKIPFYFDPGIKRLQKLAREKVHVKKEVSRKHQWIPIPATPPRNSPAKKSEPNVGSQRTWGSSIITVSPPATVRRGSIVSRTKPPDRTKVAELAKRCEPGYTKYERRR